MNTRQRCFTAILLVLLMATLCHSQSTSVTLQVTDLDTQTWNNGTWSVQIYSPPGIPCCNYKIAGTTTAVPNQTQAGALSNTGGASFAVTPNGSIAPSGTLWSFSVCPQAFPTQCFTQSVIVAGASQTVIINPPAIRININNPVGRVTAYLDIEAINGSLGSSYFNLLDGLIHVCTAITSACTYSPLSSSSFSFASPPSLGNVTPNSVFATSVQVAANGFLMTPDLSCLFHGSDPSLDQFSDVNGVPTWITSGLICQSALLYTPLGPGVNPLLGTVPAYVPGSQSFVIGAPASFPNGIAPPSYAVANLPTAATVPAIIVGSIAVVTDAATVGSCTVGGGLNKSLCTWNGSSWQSVGNGAAARVRSCDIALGDGVNAIPAATYSALVGCRNDTGQTLTITAVKCFEDVGASTCDAKTSHAGTPDILTGAISASNAWATGTQSATTSVLTTEWMTGTLVADGTSKRIVLHIVGTL